MIQVFRRYAFAIASGVLAVGAGPSMRREAIVNGEFVVVNAEVNPAIGAALKAGLAVTGLGATILSTQATLLAINVNGEGTYQSLGASVPRVLDEIQRVRAANPPSSSTGAASAPVNNAIEPTPLNGALAMRGTAAEGIYPAAIGRVGLVNGTPIGREMGMRTRVTISGMNDRAFLDAEFIANPDELQRVLLALTTRNLNISAIRNHLVDEHPQAIFVRGWGRGTALELATSVRYVLDVEAGAARTGN